MLKRLCPVCGDVTSNLGHEQQIFMCPNCGEEWIYQPWKWRYTYRTAWRRYNEATKRVKV